MSRRVPLRPRGGVPVSLAPLEALRGELVGGQAAGPRGEAARDHDRLLSVPRLVVRHDPDVDKKTMPKNKNKKSIEVRKNTYNRRKTPRSTHDNHSSRRGCVLVSCLTILWADSSRTSPPLSYTLNCL